MRNETVNYRELRNAFHYDEPEEGEYMSEAGARKAGYRSSENEQ